MEAIMARPTRREQDYRLAMETLRKILRDDNAQASARVSAVREMLDRLEGKSIMRRERTLGRRGEDELDIGQAHLDALKQFATHKLSAPLRARGADEVIDVTPINGAESVAFPADGPAIVGVNNSRSDNE
jgi:hypothetical protein